MNGLYNVYEPLVTNYDSKIRELQISQASLALQLDELTSDLTQSISKQIQFTDIKIYTEKVKKSKKKLQTTSDLLNQIQERIKKLNKKIISTFPDINNNFNKFSINLEELMKRDDETEEIPIL
jgi:hypothetical protein